MDDKLRSLLLSEAVRIGNYFLENGERDIYGLHWKSYGLQDDITDKTKSENIYNGNSGIALFLLELYKQTGEEKYLSIANEGLEWAKEYSRAVPSFNVGLYSGKMSIVFALVRFYETTLNKNYLTDALSLAREADFADQNKSDLIGGIAGVVLGLLHLHAASNEEWLLTEIGNGIGHLLEKAELGKVGLYWDRSPLNIKGLCGFAHGAAGIGFVFLELGNYFQNKAFHWVAEQAFLYETQFLDHDVANWRDLRKSSSKGVYEQEFINAYIGGNIDFFTKGGSFNAWCHGAAGIGLSRLRAYELLKNPVYLNEAHIAIETTQKSTADPDFLPTYTLCHGGGGNAEIFLEAYRVLGAEEYKNLAETIARKALTIKEKIGAYQSGTNVAAEDTSLFLGNAGIGYFYLRLLDIHQVPSILCPILTKAAPHPISEFYTSLSVSHGGIQKTILKKSFIRTMHVLDNDMPNRSKKYFSDIPVIRSRQDFKQQWIEFAQRLVEEDTVSSGSLLEDVFNLEAIGSNMQECIKSDILLQFKDKMKMKCRDNIQNLSKNAFNNQTLMLDPDFRLITFRRYYKPENIHKAFNHNKEDEEEYFLLLIPTLKGTFEEELNLFSYTLLNIFAIPATVKEAIDKMYIELNEVVTANKQAVIELVHRQILEAVYSGVLLDPKHHPLRALSPGFESAKNCNQLNNEHNSTYTPI